MKLPRITLPWRTTGRKPVVASRRARRRGAHRAAPAPRRPGRRGAVGGALTIVALTATTATAVSGSADTSADPAAVTRSTTTVAAPAGPLVVVSADPTVAKATEVLTLAESVEDHAAKAVAKKIDARATEVSELLAQRRAPAPASRSGERDAVPADGAATQGDEAAEKQADEADESDEQAEQAEKQADEAAEESAEQAGPADLAEAAPLPDPATIFPAAVDDTTGDVTPDDAQGAEEAQQVADPATTEATEAVVDTAALAEATESLEALVAEASASTVAVKAAPEEPAKPKTPAQILRAQVAAAQKAAPKLAKHADSTADDANGQISAASLSPLKFDAEEQLRTDAARQLERLNTAYKARFGSNLEINDTYRSYDEQVAVKASRGYMAAVPGYSNHGWGVAVDLGGGVETFGTEQYEWLRKNAPKFGWDNPGWARSDGRKPEAWHWEYAPLG
jgi:D-alanyl-D-alanine carboxypeptidase